MKYCNACKPPCVVSIRAGCRKWQRIAAHKMSTNRGLHQTLAKINRAGKSGTCAPHHITTAGKNAAL